MTRQDTVARPAVEILLTIRAKAVEIPTRKFFFGAILPERRSPPTLMAPSRFASLDRRGGARKINAASPPTRFGCSQVTVHRFEETIGGRAYLIEVTPVSNRWRAQLCRTPGVPTAMMPFYGQTPDEAARQLAKWLALAHRPSAPAGPGPSIPTV
jgi:hypothetical protein